MTPIMTGTLIPPDPTKDPPLTFAVFETNDPIDLRFVVYGPHGYTERQCIHTEVFSYLEGFRTGCLVPGKG